MEAQQHQELEMNEVKSEVYDIIHPTPVSLKQLSAIAISLQIWRQKVIEYRTKRKLIEFDPCSLRKETTWMKSMLPELSPTIYKTIEEVFSRFGQSLEYWQFENYKRGFFYQYIDKNYVLKDFDDFVCDYDGSIDYARTAERMMRCEGFNSEMKFIVACLYIFEDDVRRIWPSVWRNTNVDVIDFQKCPQLYYWICRLTNKLDEIPTWESETVDERMFRLRMPYNRPSMEYFWNRIPLENQVRIAAVHYIEGYNFVRFILPKLNGEQLDKIVNNGFGVDLCTMFLDLHCDEWVVLRTWFYIRNIINKSNFTNLIVHMLEINDYDTDEFYEQEKWEYLCSQIWNHSPSALKPPVIRVILSGSSWLEDFNQLRVNVKLLLTILQDVSSAERNLFLRNCWSELFKRLGRKNLQEVIELCFENEDELNQFKQNVMVGSEEVLQFCVTLLEDSCFEDLNAFASFCCAESQATRNFKQQILRLVFLAEDCKLTPENICRVGDLNEFVNDAFDDVDLSIDFKKELISSSSFMKHLCRFVSDYRVSSEMVNEFIDTLFSVTEEILMLAKMSLIASYEFSYSLHDF